MGSYYLIKSSVDARRDALYKYNLHEGSNFKQVGPRLVGVFGKDDFPGYSCDSRGRIRNVSLLIQDLSEFPRRRLQQRNCATTCLPSAAFI